MYICILMCANIHVHVHVHKCLYVYTYIRVFDEFGNTS